MRFAAFDIECTNLDASYGRLICASFFPFDARVSERNVQYAETRLLKGERDLLAWIREQWEQYDVVVTWNGKRFDVPFVNARLAHHALPLLAPKKHIDLLYYARTLRFRGARLDDFAKDVHLAHQKYNVPAEEWVKAAEGDEAAIAKIGKHNRVDVLMTYDAFLVLKPLVQNIHK